jgi:NAD(P)-dependent dehydrogenase (short-subunit alcohol dehydrogenase family)
MKKIADVTDRSLAELISLTGRTAVVTGGARGLGKAIANRLAEAGANVVIGDRDAALAQSAADDLCAGFAARIVATHMDVADTTSITATADLAVQRFGGIDIWVNNAGIFPCHRLEEMTDDVWNNVMAVNARGCFAGAREAARCMRAAGNGGVIINIASTAGFGGIGPGLAAYVASKHAVVGLTKQLAFELAADAIRVLGVAPTYCVTEGNIQAALEMSGGTVGAEEIAAMVSSKLGRAGVPDDVARVALFCASDLSIYMTGSTLLVDAGERI